MTIFTTLLAFLKDLPASLRVWYLLLMVAMGGTLWTLYNDPSNAIAWGAGGGLIGAALLEMISRRASARKLRKEAAYWRDEIDAPPSKPTHSDR